MRLHQSLAIAALVFVTPAIAQAYASEASGFTWTGMFIGINAGYGFGKSDWDISGGGSDSQTLSGGVVGLQAGYNAQLQNNLVAGIEVSTQASDIGGKSTCSGGSTCETHIDSLSDISGRLGVNYGPSMLFGKAGVAYGVMEHSITVNGAGLNDKGGDLGFVLGGGMEFYIANNITSNIEYNFYDFRSDTSRVGASNIKDSTSTSVVKAGLNLKFN